MRTVTFLCAGRSATVRRLDTGAELAWSDGVPLYYESTRDAAFAARCWAFHGLRPNAAKTLRGLQPVVLEGP